MAIGRAESVAAGMQATVNHRNGNRRTICLRHFGLIEQENPLTRRCRHFVMRLQETLPVHFALEDNGALPCTTEVGCMPGYVGMHRVRCDCLRIDNHTASPPCLRRILIPEWAVHGGDWNTLQIDS